MGLLSLVVTDLDSIEKDSVSNSKKVQPEKGKEYRTGNNTIKSWVPKKTNLDDVLAVSSDNKVSDDFIRVAYQYEITVEYSNKEVKAIPYTFEDALVLSNIELFKEKKGTTGLIKK